MYSNELIKGKGSKTTTNEAGGGICFKAQRTPLFNYKHNQKWAFIDEISHRRLRMSLYLYLKDTVGTACEDFAFY